MKTHTEYKAAASAFGAALSATKGASPSYTSAREVFRLLADKNAAAAAFAAAIPETPEEAAHKISLAAASIRSGTFESAGSLAAEADAIAEALAAGGWDASLAARLQELLKWCEYDALAFYCNHGVVSDNHALEHIRTTLAGLTRPRLAA